MSWPEAWKHHLKVRLETLGILIGGALLLSGLLALIFHFTFPLFPQNWQLEFQMLQEKPFERMRVLEDRIGDLPLLPVYFVLVQIAQVLLAPIPGQLMGLLGGWLFGFWGGLSLSVLGLALGSFLAMLIGRFGGRWLLDRLLTHKIVERFDHMVEESGLLTFFMLFLLPALPDDALCLVAGMTNLRLPWLLGAAIVGRLPGMAVLTWVGTELTHPDWLMNAVLLGLGLLSFVLWLFQDPLEAAFARWSKQGQKRRDRPSGP